jgi:hypothetical protein
VLGRPRTRSRLLAWVGVGAAVCCVAVRADKPDEDEGEDDGRGTLGEAGVGEGPEQHHHHHHHHYYHARLLEPALEGLAGHPGTQALRHPGTQASRHADTQTLSRLLSGRIGPNLRARHACWPTARRPTWGTACPAVSATGTCSCRQDIRRRQAHHCPTRPTRAPRPSSLPIHPAPILLQSRPHLHPGHASSPAPRRARVPSATQRRPLPITSYHTAPNAARPPTVQDAPACAKSIIAVQAAPSPPPLSPQTEPPTRDCLRSAAYRLPSAACHCPTLKSCRALPVPLAILPLFQHFAHHGLRKGHPPG